MTQDAIDVGTTKVCTLCGLEKPLRFFYDSATCAGGHRPECIKCARPIAVENRRRDVGVTAPNPFAMRRPPKAAVANDAAVDDESDADEPTERAFNGVGLSPEDIEEADRWSDIAAALVITGVPVLDAWSQANRIADGVEPRPTFPAWLRTILAEGTRDRAQEANEQRSATAIAPASRPPAASGLSAPGAAAEGIAIVKMARGLEAAVSGALRTIDDVARAAARRAAAQPDTKGPDDHERRTDEGGRPEGRDVALAAEGRVRIATADVLSILDGGPHRRSDLIAALGIRGDKPAQNCLDTCLGRLRRDGKIARPDGADGSPWALVGAESKTERKAAGDALNRAVAAAPTPAQKKHREVPSIQVSLVAPSAPPATFPDAPAELGHDATIDALLTKRSSLITAAATKVAAIDSAIRLLID